MDWCGDPSRILCGRRAALLAAAARPAGASAGQEALRYLGDIELAEAAQEAFAVAAQRWPRDGAPDSPTGWLIATARNRAIDRIRRERTLMGEDRAARPRAA